MERLCSDDVLGSRRGTVPAARTWTLEEIVGGAFHGKENGKSRKEEDLEVAAHLSSTLDWLRTPSGSLPPLTPCAAESVASPAAKAEAAPAYAAAPPAWEPEAPLLPAQAARALRLGAAPREALATMRRFFAEELPSEIAECEASWTMTGTAFVDYHAVEVETRIFEVSRSAEPASVATLKHTSSSDIVRFNMLADKALAFARASGLAARDERKPAAGGARPVLMDLEEDDDLFSDDEDAAAEEESWEARVDAMIADAGVARGAALREQAWQTLATWGEKHPACRRHLARAVLESVCGSRLVARSLRAGAATPLAELYPMAVAVKFAAMGLERAADADLAALLAAAMEELPELAARPLRDAASRLA